jgi:hypothetical protein
MTILRLECVATPGQGSMSIRARTVSADEAPGARVPAVMNGSLVAKLAAQCRAEWMICMPLGHMAEPAA